MTSPDILPPSAPIEEPLHIYENTLNKEELLAVVVLLKKNKASGHDVIPADFWIHLATNDFAINVLLKLLNTCLSERRIPESWQHASISLVFKKGDSSLPQNFRPIALLCVGYKCLAMILLRRIRAADSEDRVRSSQFGFRKKYSTMKALAILRKIIDSTIQDVEAKLHIVFLA